MNMREIINLVEGAKRVEVWSGATITVLHNPPKAVFTRFAEEHEVLRGLLSEDGRDVWLWPARLAVHPNIQQALGIPRTECIFWNRGRWTGPNLHDPQTGLYVPALQRLTPMKHDPKEIDDLLAALASDDEPRKAQ